MLDQLSMIGFHDLPVDWLSQWTRQVERVTREDVVRAFQRLDPQRMVTVVVGAAEEAPAAAAAPAAPAQQQPRLR
jgi:zinc protease